MRRLFISILSIVVCFVVLFCDSTVYARYEYDITCQVDGASGGNGRGISCTVQTHIQTPQFYEFTGHGYVFKSGDKGHIEPGNKSSTLTKNANRKFTTTKRTNGTWYLHVYSYHNLLERGRKTPTYRYARFGPWIIGPPPTNSGGGTSSGGGVKPPGGGSNPPGGGTTAPPAPPPPPPPTISANPSSRGWSQDPLSVSVLFNNASSCIASWSDGSGSLSSNGTLSKSLGLGYGGSWNITASASGPGGSVSNTFGPYRIDRKSPAIDFSPEKGGFIDSGQVGISFRDEHSGVKRIRYVWSESKGSRPSWSWVSRSGVKVNESVSLPGYGTWYLHAEVEDNVGLTCSRVGGPYVVVNELDVPPYRRWVFIEE